MQQYSKYRIITVGFILMFIFAIAAIYTNTKDIVAQKTNMNKAAEQQKINNNQNDIRNTVIDESDYSDSQNEIRNKLSDLNNRIHDLEKAVFAKDNTEDIGVHCRIQGIADDGHFIPMSDEEAINESKENNKEVIISCIFK